MGVGDPCLVAGARVMEVGPLTCLAVPDLPEQGERGFPVHLLPGAGVPASHHRVSNLCKNCLDRSFRHKCSAAQPVATSWTTAPQPG